MTDHRFTRQHTRDVQMHIWAKPYRSWETPPEGEVWNYSIRESDVQVYTEEVMVASVPVQYTVPGGIDLLSKAIDTLEQKKRDIQAQAYQQIVEVDKVISSLKLLEHKPDPDALDGEVLF